MKNLATLLLASLLALAPSPAAAYCPAVTGLAPAIFWVDSASRVSPASKLATLGGKPVVPGIP